MISSSKFENTMKGMAYISGSEKYPYWLKERKKVWREQKSNFKSQSCKDVETGVSWSLLTWICHKPPPPVFSVEKQLGLKKIIILAVQGLCCCSGFSLVAVLRFLIWWPLFLQSTGSRTHGLSNCSSWAPGPGLSSCGALASLLRGMWNLPRPGTEPVSPALAGGFLTSEPPGKAWDFVFNEASCISVFEKITVT